MSQPALAAGVFALHVLTQRGSPTLAELHVLTPRGSPTLAELHVLTPRGSPKCWC